MAAVISASPKAVMMASMLRLEVLVDGGGKKMTRVILRISRTDYREWRWKTVPARIVPVGRD